MAKSGSTQRSANVQLHRHLFGRRSPALVAALALAIGVATLVTGAGRGVEHSFSSLRWSLRTTHASGKIAILEIDAASLSRLNRWPWPRSLYAQAIDRLTSAGARSVAFDVDVSAYSAPAEDRAMAAALRRAGGAVILPTFRQRAREGSSVWVDSLPIPMLRENAFLAAVNVFPASDGVIRSYPLGVNTVGSARPSLAAMIAETGRVAGKDFPIDYAIDPATIPRFSFADLLNGAVSLAEIRGRRFIIGATAIELGDRYAVPNRGVLPGVVVQALAAETLLRHGVPASWGGLPVLLAIGVLLAFAATRRRARARIALIGTPLLLLPLTPLVSEPLGIGISIVPAWFALIAAIAGELLTALHAELVRRRCFDRATGLPNLTALQSFAPTHRTPTVTVARVDRLAEMTASLGGNASAAAVSEIAQRIERLLKVPVYRIDQDAVAWLGDVPPEADDHFAGLYQILRAPITVSDQRVGLHASFGVSSGAVGGGELAAGALIAARRARTNGAPWDRYVESEGEHQRSQLELLGEVASALASGEIWVAYQPKYSLAENRIVGAETLVRWRHPQRGTIPPDSFIPLLEAEGQIADLTRFVLDTALADCARWSARGLDLTVAINLSAGLLQDAGIVELVAAALAEHRVAPARLTIELTESAIIADVEVAAQRLHALRALGVNLSIDDYGTGQSTLNYLKRVPASELKIDKSFVLGIGDSPSDLLLVKSTIELAHALGLKVVAEGVEDQACLDQLRALQCDQAQGWHIGRPVPFAELTSMIEELKLAA